MKKIFLLLFLLPIVALGQKPDWVLDNNYYPRNQYLTGFATNVGVESPDFIQALKAAAKSELIEGIQVSIKSLKELHKSEQAGVYSENFYSINSSFANADINGLKIEYYYDKSTHTGYAIAYADKSEVKGYYKANISFTIQKIEAAISDAQKLETTGNKIKAKKTLEEATSFFADLNFAQSLLIAIEGGESDNIQIPQSLSLKSQITQALSRLQTATTVYVKSAETNFGRPVQIIAPKLKSELLKYGCCFIPSEKDAEWILTIKAATRRGANVDGLCFSYLDVEVSLTERVTGKEIFSNTFTNIKGGALDYENAGLKTFDNAVPQIVEKLKSYLE